MGTYNSAVITNGGQSMIAQAVAGASLEFTTIKTSNYAYPAGTNLATLTTINGIKQSKDITGAAVYNSRVIKISSAVDNTGISTAYTINTIGIYAKVGSSTESLFAVVTASAADTMPAYDSKPYSYIYEINLTMQNAANVTVTVNAAGLVNVVDLNAAKVEIQGEIADLRSHLTDVANLIADATIYHESLAESGTGVGASWNLYYNKSLPKGTKIRFSLLSYSGSLFTSVRFRTYDSNNVMTNYVVLPIIGALNEFELIEDCERIWVQINRSATENGVSARFLIEDDSKGLWEKVTNIEDSIPKNTQEVLRSDVLKNIGKRFNTAGVEENAGGDSWVVSDYLPVGEGITVTGFSYSSSRPAIVEYNANKTPTGVIATQTSSEYITRTYTQPTKVAYVRIQTITTIGYDTSAIRVITSPNKIFHVEKDGSGDFTKLSDAINEAVRYMDSTVYVGAGTWDLIDELGEDYINSVSSTQRGLYLKNRIHVICSSNSKITCNYAGSRDNTVTWLSAFNAGEYGFTLENATIESSNCRYSVHDERDTDADAYNNRYINCRMTHDNTAGGYNQCIGGGLGLNGHVVIDGCIFKNPARTNYQIVYYHNTAGTGKSFVEVKGCYFEGSNTLGFQWYGTSPATQKSTLFAHDNSLGSAIQHTGVSGATIENTEVIAWNNEIRTA